MNTRIVTHGIYGRCLFADNGVIEVGIPLEFGLRVGHFSFVGEGNVFFEQPQDLPLFRTDRGWAHRGGHRLWLAPESTDDYYPDNEPITYAVEDDSIILTQNEDPWLHVIKQMVITLDENRATVTHRVTNCSDQPLNRAIWGVSALAAGGAEIIDLPQRRGGLTPWTRLAAWDYTSFGDPRVTYTREQIRIDHTPLEDFFKIGVGRPISPVRYENGSTVFKLHFEIQPDRLYPDGDICFETYVSGHMVEIESLSPLLSIAPKECADYVEVWELLRKE